MVHFFVEERILCKCCQNVIFNNFRILPLLTAVKIIPCTEYCTAFRFIKFGRERDFCLACVLFNLRWKILWIFLESTFVSFHGKELFSLVTPQKIFCTPNILNKYCFCGFVSCLKNWHWKLRRKVSDNEENVYTFLRLNCLLLF